MVPEAAWHRGQRVGQFEGPHGFNWLVCLTGDPDYYLFVCIANPLFKRPVLKANLTDEVREALAQGEVRV